MAPLVGVTSSVLLDTRSMITENGDVHERVGIRDGARILCALELVAFAKGVCSIYGENRLTELRIAIASFPSPPVYRIRILTIKTSPCATLGEETGGFRLQRLIVVQARLRPKASLQLSSNYWPMPCLTNRIVFKCCIPRAYRASACYPCRSGCMDLLGKA